MPGTHFTHKQLLIIMFKPNTAAFHGRSGALTRFALRHHQDTR